MQNLARSTPTVLNTAYNKFQFWDGRARSLEEQALGPILNAGEMHRDMGSLLRDLSAIDGYKTMFAAAYREDGVSEAAIGKALAAYERTLITTEAPFDAWVDGDESAITDSAKRGFVLFEGKAKCNERVRTNQPHKRRNASGLHRWNRTPTRRHVQRTIRKRQNPIPPATMVAIPYHRLHR